MKDRPLAAAIAAEYFSPGLNIDADGWQVEAFEDILSELGIDPHVSVRQVRSLYGFSVPVRAVRTDE